MSHSNLTARILAGDRRALAKGITLIESSKVADQETARTLLSELMPDTGNSIRIGLSGTPGVGKSTFIEALGMRLIESGYHVCVLTIDPSSRLTGGSILGDKTRMQTLANHPNAFIRPSPSGNTLGGVARRSRETMLACEAAGFDLILIETVGVGQSETAVADMTDLFLLLLQPASGDELQGIKRGIMELADIIAINKADGELLAAANETARTTLQATHYLQPRHKNWDIPVIPCSAVNQHGLDSVQKQIFAFIKNQKKHHRFAAHRETQAINAFEQEIIAQLQDRLQNEPAYQQQFSALQAQIKNKTLSPSGAARALVDALIKP